MILSTYLIGRMFSVVMLRYPYEACGVIVASRKTSRPSNRPSNLYALTNVSPSPKTHFEVNPQEQLEHWERFDRNSLDPVAIFHSHTQSPPVPSPKDVEQHDPSLVMIIIGTKDPLQPRIMAYRITENGNVLIEPITIQGD